MTYLKTSVGITWIMGNVFIWSSVEPCIGIVCACLPTLQSLLRYTIARVFGTSIGRNTDISGSIRAAARRGISRKPRIPPDWDEALLVTHDVQVEMDGLKGNDSKEGNIKVDTDFRMVEEQRNYENGVWFFFFFSGGDKSW